MNDIESPKNESPIISTPPNSKRRKKLLILGLAGLVVIVAAGVVMTMITRQTAPKQQASQQPAPATSSYDQQAAQNLSHGNCAGSGSGTIIPPMKLDQINSIQPYGLMVGGHVTPVDHQYYIGTDPKALRDTYDVVVPIDGRIVSIEHRGSQVNTPLHSVDVPSSDEYRIVIAHSCSFMTYVDLVTSLDDSLKAKLPVGWTPQTLGNSGLNIPVKQGDVIGHIGGQTLDFAVWDLTQKPLPGLLLRPAYDSAEPWKVFTAPPSKFFASSIKQQVLAKYIRTAEPIDGKIDYDQAGKLVGSWFQTDTNGYEGGKNKGVQNYWAGHLAIAPNYIDPKIYVVSIGSFASRGDAEQFGIRGYAPDPSTITQASGPVKYELVQQELQNPDGTLWQGAFQKDIKVVNNTSVKGVILLQLVSDSKLRVEVFPGKTAAQVSGFSDKALNYDRGEGASVPVSNTATH